MKNLWPAALLLSSVTMAATKELTILSPRAGFSALNIKGGAPKGSYFEWTQAYVGFEKNQDWTQHTALLVKIENASTKPADLLVEVRDAESRDYWSRANLSYTLPPGVNEIRIPTELYAGEALRPGRPLDRARIRAVIFARGESSEGIPLRLHDVRLVVEARAQDSGVRAFDFGPDGSPVFAGFEGVFASSNYSAARGFGFQDARVWLPYREACWVRGPESLSQDCLMVSKGAFRVDLPNGRYRAIVNIDHPGPFWGEYPFFRRRIVRAQGKAVVDEKGGPTEAFDHYFRNEKTEVTNPTEAFDAFVTKRFREKKFDFEVKDGHLRLEFENEGCPEIPCFGLALSSLIVVPTPTPPAAENFLRDLNERKRREFETLSRVIASPPEAPLAPGPNPFEVEPSQALRVAGFPGETLTMELKVRARRSKQNIRAEILDLTRAKAKGKLVRGETGWAGRQLIRTVADGSRLGFAEKHVHWQATDSVPSDRAKTLLLSWDLPVDTPSGTYRGSLRLKSEGGTREFPIEVRVGTRQLPEPDLPIGPFGHTVLENWWPGAPGSPRGQSLERKSLQKMRDAGLTAFSFNPEITLSGSGDKLAVAAPEIDRIMGLARAMGFRELVGYGNILRDQDVCRAGFSVAEWTKFFDGLEKLSVAKNWLPLTLLICDEPEGESLTATIEALKRLPRRPLSARVNWGTTTHTEAGASTLHNVLVDAVSMPFLADFEVTRLPKGFYYYNDLSRWTFGLRTFALKRRHGLRGRLAWTWNQNAVDPFNPIDGREDDFHWCTSDSAGELLCTLDWHRTVVKGVSDYRRAQLLESLAKTHSDKPAAHRAKVLLETIEKRGGEKTLPSEEAQKLADQIFEAIEAFGDR